MMCEINVSHRYQWTQPYDSALDIDLDHRSMCRGSTSNIFLLDSIKLMESYIICKMV